MKKYFLFFGLTLVLSACSPNSEDSMSEFIQVESPKAGDKITCEITISGQARGYWYFEGSFPAELYDEKGTLLYTAPIQSQEPWMTEDFVRFEEDFVYKGPAGNGSLVLKRENVSGLPEHDMQIEVPVVLGDCNN